MYSISQPTRTVALEGCWKLYTIKIPKLRIATAHKYNNTVKDVGTKKKTHTQYTLKADKKNDTAAAKRTAERIQQQKKSSLCNNLKIINQVEDGKIYLYAKEENSRFFCSSKYHGFSVCSFFYKRE